MRPLPERRWQRTVWRQNTIHPDYDIAIERHFYSVPYTYAGKTVDVGLVPVKAQGIAGRMVWPLEPENSRALRVERPLSDEFIHVAARLEIGVQLDERGGPEMTGSVGLVDLP